MLTVWDRLFGTFEPERETVRYGLTAGKRVATPSQALVGGYPALLAEVRHAPTRRAALRSLVSSPG